jgi:hypothetical protein
MQRLIILGDSFAIPTGDTDPAQTWTKLVGPKLQELTGQECPVQNGAMMGSAQDWAWRQLQNYMPNAQPTDRIVICLTHPSRFWFLENIPQLSNVNIIDIDHWIDKDCERAIEGFLRYIQRPELDTQLLVQRLGWLAYQVKSRGLRRPLIIKCFDQDAAEAEKYPELNWANGNLFEDIQYWEFEQPEQGINSQYWYGIDGRYNHMILSNHAILAPKIAEALYHDSTLDLKQGFIKGVLGTGTLHDTEFVKKELSVSVVAEMVRIKEREKNKPILPWRTKKGLDRIVSGS